MATERAALVIGDEEELRALRRLSSSQFRVAYVTLEEPVAVTANGRVFAYFLPVAPAPRSAQLGQPIDGSSSDVGAFSRDAGLTEAPDGSLADSGASTPPARRASAKGRRTSQPRTPKPSAAPTVMPQPKIDAVLRKVNRVTGSER